MQTMLLALLLFGWTATAAGQTFDVPLTFTGSDGSTSANALVEVEVAGQRTLLILDNGVTYQMFASPFAQQHKLPVKGRIIGASSRTSEMLL